MDTESSRNVLCTSGNRDNISFPLIQNHETWTRDTNIIKNHAHCTNSYQQQIFTSMTRTLALRASALFSSTTKSAVVSPVKATSGVVTLFVIYNPKSKLVKHAYIYWKDRCKTIDFVID